jgi:hypothetical protein
MIYRFMEVDKVVEELRRSTSLPQTITSYGSIETIHPQNSLLSDGDEEAILEAPLLSKHPNIKNNNNNNKTSFSSSTWLIHLAINISFLANIILFITKVFVAVFSGSMAILATAFESFLDILSNAIIFFTIRVIQQKNLYDYPVGKVNNIYQDLYICHCSLLLFI